MKVAGVIVEFNPFHNGHDVHIQETRELTNCDYVVAVMSGNFVQRGEPALCDKWHRTKMALMCGVDIVIEIPLPYVIAGADYFARGSVGLLAATGVVNSLCFGSESGDLAALMEAGKILAEEPPLYKEILRNSLDSGISFAAAKGAALEACLSKIPEGLLVKPNNGLAMEYCKALHLLGNPMNVFTTHRQKGGPSATKIRRAFRAGESVEGLLPAVAHDILLSILEQNAIANFDDFSDIFRYMIMSASSNKKDDISLLCKDEGLENRFRKFVGEHHKISDLLAAVKTKRYTYTRLQRFILGVLLKISQADMDTYEAEGGIQYIRVLGFKRESQRLLGEITRRAILPVITTGKALDELICQNGLPAHMLKKELIAGDIFRISTGERGGFYSERGTGLVVV